MGVFQVFFKYASILYNFWLYISDKFAQDMFEANKYVLAVVYACVPSAVALCFIVLGVVIEYVRINFTKAFLVVPAMLGLPFLICFVDLVREMYAAKSYQDFKRRRRQCTNQAIIVGQTDLELEKLTYDYVFTDHKNKLPNCKEILPLCEASGSVDLILIGPFAQYEQQVNVLVKQRIYLYFFLLRSAIKASVLIDPPTMAIDPFVATAVQLSCPIIAQESLSAIAMLLSVTTTLRSLFLLLPFFFLFSSFLPLI